MAMLKNTAGRPSSSFTMMIVAFVVVTLWLVLSIVENLGPIKIRAFSGTEAMAFLSPLIALYWGRRHTEAQTETNNQPTNKKE
jgi:hypothetical protein